LDQHFGRYWFREVQIEAGIENAPLIFFANACRNCDSAQRLAGIGSNFLKQRTAIFVGHRDIRYEHIGFKFFDRL
jgi:hypothetical protein